VNLDEFLSDTHALVDEALDRWLPTVEEDPGNLHEAMRYALFAGGKRLRPAIARAACRMHGGSDEEVLPCACALEMLHTYSLIHDDLPAIDDDDLRRGQPTCHKRFGEATAILAGDALQTTAFHLLAARTPRTEAVTRLVLELAEAAGPRGMVGGEVADIEAEGKMPKTAALFRASAVMSGIAAGAPDEGLTALQRYGTALGLAFQIVDDILDETSDAQTLGKSTGKDRAARKLSYPAAVGLEESRTWARRYADEAVQSVADLPDSGLLAALAEFAVTRIR
jgi:geranylgeranyl diphosphate synthase type II